MRQPHHHPKLDHAVIFYIGYGQTRTHMLFTLILNSRYYMRYVVGSAV